VLHDRSGAPLPDIRTIEDNEAAADAITEHIRELTQSDDSALHVSIAGGRKTLGFFVGYALSLYGRRQDRLSHVLVTQPYESHPDFYYPTPYSRVIHTFPPDSRPLDTQNAEITLAEIPFVRLRDGLPKPLLQGRTRFSEVIAQAQRSLDPPELILDRATRRIRCSGIDVELKPIDFAFYAWFAGRLLDAGTGLKRTGVSESEAMELLYEYRRLVSEYSGDYERVEKTVFEKLEKGTFHVYFDQRKSRLHKALDEALGEAMARRYYIERGGDEGFALRLDVAQVRFEDSDASPLPGRREHDIEAAFGLIR
jgi:hypothetical protein